VIAALDVGGSSIKAGLVERRRHVGDLTITELDHAAPLDLLLSRFITAIESIPPTRRVAIAMPGPFDHDAGVSRMQHKLVNLHGVELAPALQSRLGREVLIRFCNDAAAAVMGEAVAGAGSRYGRVFGITLGTGLGAAFAVDGRLAEQEAGVTVGDLHTMPMPSGERSDNVISARAYLERLSRADDEVAESVAYGHDIAEFVGPITRALGADVVLVGGGGADSYDAFGPAMRARLDVPVEPMTLGRSAALIGAAEICFGAR